MNKSPIFLVFSFFIFAAGAFAQQTGRPVAILVDNIGGSVPVRGDVRQAAPAQGSRGMSATERRAFELMNAERQISGLPMLEWSNEAAALARMHARNMAESRFFSHKGPDGETVDGRAARLGVKWLAIGENIATMKGYEDPATMAVETWMHSTAHKRNILNGVYNQSAIAAAVASDGTVYFTQVFLSR
ncbi:MAG: CAP domain-containing protein [Pyrinomonadaceae bacterium]